MYLRIPFIGGVSACRWRNQTSRIDAWREPDGTYVLEINSWEFTWMSPAAQRRWKEQCRKERGAPQAL